MKKTKLEKGITLIALIITIVVLLIIAVVAIGAVQESKIISHTQNAASGYNQAKDNEIDILSSYEQLIEKNNPNSKKIDDEYISQLLTKAFVQGTITEEDFSKQLKDYLLIENEEYYYDMLAIEFSDTMYIYIYEIDRLYKLDNSTNTIVYIEKEKCLEHYIYGQNMKEIKKELEKIFIGNTISEMQEKYSAGELDEYVLNNSDKITAINIRNFVTETGEICISNITFINGENKMILDEEDNYSMSIFAKEGTYYRAEIAYRNIIYFVNYIIKDNLKFNNLRLSFLLLILCRKLLIIR